MENTNNFELGKAPKEITFDVVISSKNKLHKSLQSIGILPKKKSFTMGLTVMGNMIRISRMVLKMQSELRQDENFVNKTSELVIKHVPTMAKIIATAICNTRQKPSRRLVNLLINNLNTKELNTLMSYVLHQMNLPSFVAAMHLMGALQILQAPIEAKVTVTEDLNQ